MIFRDNFNNKVKQNCHRQLIIFIKFDAFKKQNGSFIFPLKRGPQKQRSQHISPALNLRFVEKSN